MNDRRQLLQEALAARPKDDTRDLASGPYYVPASRGVDPFQFMPVMLDLLPRAYLALGQLDSSIASYERAVDLSLSDWPIFPRYHYRLGQAYERKGLKEKAIEQYTKFLNIWGKADPMYREPADARARLARLMRG